MSRTAACTKADARARFAMAAGYIEAAERTLQEENSREFLNVAAGNDVLAGIAASDAICCVRLGLRHRGDNHRDATDLLKSATRTAQSSQGPWRDCSASKTKPTMGSTSWQRAKPSTRSNGLGTWSIEPDKRSRHDPRRARRSRRVR
jgi:hypothetical protein